MPELPEEGPLPPNALLPGTHCERVMEAFCGRAYDCTTLADLRAALAEAMHSDRTCMIHVELDTPAQLRPQEIGWLTRSGHRPEDARRPPPHRHRIRAANAVESATFRRS